MIYCDCSSASRRTAHDRGWKLFAYSVIISHSWKSVHGRMDNWIQERLKRSHFKFLVWDHLSAFVWSDLKKGAYTKCNTSRYVSFHCSTAVLVELLLGLILGKIYGSCPRLRCHSRSNSPGETRRWVSCCSFKEGVSSKLGEYYEGKKKWHLFLEKWSQEGN